MVGGLTLERMNMRTRKNRTADMMPERRGEMNQDKTRKRERGKGFCPLQLLQGKTAFMPDPLHAKGGLLSPGFLFKRAIKFSPTLSSSDHLTPSCPLATREKPIVAPTMQCVPEMGSFKNEATSCHTAEPKQGKCSCYENIRALQSYPRPWSTGRFNLTLRTCPQQWAHKAAKNFQEIPPLRCPGRTWSTR